MLPTSLCSRIDSWFRVSFQRLQLGSAAELSGVKQIFYSDIATGFPMKVKCPSLCPPRIIFNVVASEAMLLDDDTHIDVCAKVESLTSVFVRLFMYLI